MTNGFDVTFQISPFRESKHRRVLAYVFRFTAIVGISLFACSPSQADEKSNDSPTQFSNDNLKYFETHVRPLLVEHCQECHSGEKQKGSLRLDSRNAILMGGESGPAVAPGKPSESILMEAVRYESFEMPPKGKLSEESIAVFEKWIADGAAWPGADTHSVIERTGNTGFSDEDKSWWAIQPVRNPDPPIVSKDSWSRNEIDRFLLQQMTSNDLTPAPEADRATLIRRVSFDLIGLPPTPAEVAQFTADEQPMAYERLVDRLLDSPQFGERWARHWLDVVRYADSDGYRIDHFRPDAWRYRDYVVGSLNSNKPYDRFVQEQIAGDELFPDNPDARIATGFLRHWIYEYNNRDVRGQWDLILNEVTDTTSDVFLGVGLQCAKCHDHKYDPLLQKDYFRLRAFFEAIQPEDKYIVASTAEQQTFAERMKAWEADTESIRTQIADLEAGYRTKARQDAIEKYPADIQALLTAEHVERSPLDQQLYALALRQVDYEYDGLANRIKGEDNEKLLALKRELAKFDAQKPKAMPTALTVTDVSTAAPDTVVPKKRTVVRPGFPSILDSSDATIVPLAPQQTTTGRRAALAKWLTQPDNPLSTRVIVNRIWQGHFGRGLAVNASDFGTLGGPPTHPELLDWLTSRFIHDGWNMKELHRRIVTSSAYRMSSEHPEMNAFQTKDPTNRHYWRSDVRRLDAEQIRDAILAVSKQLDLTAGGSGVQSDVPRRSIYLRVMRNERDPLLDVFDLPLFFASTSSRDTTTSPVQSLLLFNSQIMMNHSLKFASTLRADSDEPSNAVVDGPSSTIERLWQRAYSRNPTTEELADAERFLAEQKQRIESERGEMQNVSIPVGRLPYRDGQAILVNAEDQPIRMSRESTEALNPEEFTLEACIQVRSVFETGSVRTIASKWNGDENSPGWTFGVTGKKSRRKPQTLVMQLYGKDAADKIIEAAIFSDQHLELNTPYYVAVSFKAGSSSHSGEVTFHVKNLSNDDEMLNTISVPHKIMENIQCEAPLSIGSRIGSKDSSFDGLIDDVRLSSAILTQEQLLLAGENASPVTIAFWRFEPAPGLLEDSATDLKLTVHRSDKDVVSAELAALGDLCHIVLNSSEFLYVK